MSGLAAAWLWGLTKGLAPPPECRLRRSGVKDIKVCRVRRLGKGTVHRGVPITTVPATLERFSSSLSFDNLARAAHEAMVRYGVTRVEEAPQRLLASSRVTRLCC